MRDFIKDNGGVITLLIIALAIGAAYLDWRINSLVTETVNTAGYITPEQIEVFKVNQISLKEDIGELKATADKLDGKIERIVQILLED
jgi:hypothetical protein